MKEPFTDRVASFAERIERNNAYYEAFAQDVAQRTEARDYSHAFRAFCSLVPDAGVVLDVGCGDGAHAEHFASLGYRVIGIDPSPDMGAAAAQRGIEVLDGTFETLYEIRPPLADGVWAAASLLHVPRADVPKGLANVRSVIRPGAALFFTVRCGDDATWDSYDDTGAERSRLIQLFGESDLLNLLKKSGFVVRDSWTEESTWGRPSTWLSVVAAGPLLAAPDVVRVVGLLEDAGVEVWLDGGWGVDALLETQTRPHADLDLVVRIDDVPKIRETLKAIGYGLVEGEPHTNFVLGDRSGRRVDVHPFRFDENGDGIYRMQNGEDWTYGAEGFTGTGAVDGRPVRCLSPEMQVKCHDGGYAPDDNDLHDMRALAARFGVELPAIYRG